MERTFIKDIYFDGEYFVCGWIIKKNDKFLLHDSTGELNLLNYNEKKDPFFRCAAELRIKVENGEGYIVEKKFINENKVNIEKDEIDLFKPYLNYMDYSYIDILKQMNKDEEIIEEYLKNNEYMKIYLPTLYTNVNEYGINEWEVRNPINKNIEYFLLQSPEIEALLLAIGGLDKTYSINKCFRLDEKDNDRTVDNLIEFTQITITETFISNEQGQQFISCLLKNLIDKAYGFKKYKFFELTYEDAIRYYGEDKVDLRYKNFYTPSFSFEDKKYEILFFNKKLNHKQVNDFYKILSKHLKNDYINIYTFDDLKEKGIEGEILKIGNDLEVEENSTLLVIDYKEKNRSFFSKIKKIFYPKLWNNSLDYAITWITNYPLFKYNAINYDVKDINFNFFSNIDGELTKPLKEKELKKNSRCIDLVINGIEIASGGERLFNKEKFLNICNFFNLNQNQYDYYIEALQTGSPKVFTISLGWERLELVLHNKYSIKRFQTLPKTNSGKDYMTHLPKAFK